jgi:homoserine dehydrogenase
MYNGPGLVLIGPGGVGSKVLEQLRGNSHKYIDMVVADTKQVVSGLVSDDDLSRVLGAKRNGGLQSSDNGLDRLENLPRYFLPGSIVINAMPTVFSSNGSAGGDIPLSVMYDIKALRRGANVVAAHKSSFGSPNLYKRVKDAASGSGAMYLPAGVFMGPTRAAEILEWLKDNGVGIVSAQGVVNGTANNMLQEIGQGASYGDSLQEQIRLGNAEKPDGREDVQGYDAITKMKVPAIIFGNYKEDQLFGLGDERSNLSPSARRVVSGNGHLGIEGVTEELLQKLKSESLTLKLVGTYDGRTGNIAVGPVTLPLDDSMAQVNGTTNILVLNLKGHVNVTKMMSDIYGRYTTLQFDQTEMREHGEGMRIQRQRVQPEYKISPNARDFTSFLVEIDYNPRTSQLTVKGPGAGVSETAAGLLGAVDRISRKMSNDEQTREDMESGVSFEDSM